MATAINISDIEADKALQSLLADFVFNVENKPMQVYASGEQPNIGLDDEFMIVDNNGNIRSLTKPMGFFTGNVAITVYCKVLSNNVVRRNAIKWITSQISDAVNGRSVEYENIRYFFELSTTPITPTTVNTTTGYAMTVLNVAWHNTNLYSFKSRIRLCDGERISLRGGGYLLLAN
jgi:hypothetical protein